MNKAPSRDPAGSPLSHDAMDLPRSPAHDGPSFTVFIPTYNRAHTLGRTLESLEASTFRDFQVVVVDDGSTDGTEALVRAWKERTGHDVVFVWQENQGKHAAHNRALELARGELFITLDSDDSMLDTALERLWKHWQSIPAAQREHFAGVAGICVDEDGKLTGDPYPQAVIDASYLDIFRQCRMNGERREALRTSVLRAFPYPRFTGERHVRPTLILRRMAHQYLVRFTNEPLQINRHAPDGISAQRFRYRFRNPRGFALFYEEEITQHAAYHSEAGLRDLRVQYLRFALHAGTPRATQRRVCGGHGPWARALPKGLALYMADRIKARLRGIRR
jgi:glycosyltransferase involved in cell wall biosynthesis